MNCIPNSFGMFGDYLKQDTGWPFGLPPALLPISQRCHLNAQQRREFTLGKVKLFAQAFDVRAFENECTAGKRFSPQDSSSLSDAGNKLAEISFVHGYSSSSSLSVSNT